MEILFKMYIFVIVKSICIAVSVKDFYPYGEQNGDTILPRGVNQYCAKFLQLPFHIGNQKLFVSYVISTNGFITFDKVSNDIDNYVYTVGKSPCDQLYHKLIVAPFMTLTSTSTYGTVQFREAFDVAVLQRINQDVRNATGLLSYNAHHALIATWTDMTFASYSGNTDDIPMNNFQAVVSTDGFYTFSIFYYAGISWNQGDYTGSCTGDTNTGIGDNCQARIGYSSEIFILDFDGCCSPMSLTIQNRTNCNRPGVWITSLWMQSFPRKSIVSVTPLYIDMMGHKSLRIIIPDAFNAINQVDCSLGDALFHYYSPICTIDHVSNGHSVLLCFVEFLLTYGIATLNVAILRENMNPFTYYPNTLFFLPPVPEVFITVLNESVIDYSVCVELNWNAVLISQLNPDNVLVDISMHFFDPVKKKWTDTISISENVNNSGEVIIKLSQPNAGLFLSEHLVIGVTGNSGPDIYIENGIYSKMFIFELTNFASKHERKSVHDADVMATVDMMGHRKLNMTFPTTQGQVGLGCKFNYSLYIQFTKAVASADNKYVLCYVPFLYSYGLIQVQLITGYYGSTTFLSTEEIFPTVSPQNNNSSFLRNNKHTEKFGKKLVFHKDETALSFFIDVLPSYPRLTVKQATPFEGKYQLQMLFTWDPSDIPPEYPILNAFIYQYNDDTQQWMTAMMVSPQYVQPGAGTATVDLSQHAVTVFFNNKVLFGLGYVQGDEDFVIFSKMYYPGMDD